MSVAARLNTYRGERFESRPDLQEGEYGTLLLIVWDHEAQIDVSCVDEQGWCVILNPVADITARSLQHILDADNGERDGLVIRLSPPAVVLTGP
ncbi:hypothetical protein FOPE_10851 [Fonsecaea pedrosoi]|nr:hypothetical protein FOPE_10851 [Fonsecaea pedrosoi]